MKETIQKEVSEFLSEKISEEIGIDVEVEIPNPLNKKQRSYFDIIADSVDPSESKNPLSDQLKRIAERAILDK